MFMSADWDGTLWRGRTSCRWDGRRWLAVAHTPRGTICPGTISSARFAMLPAETDGDSSQRTNTSPSPSSNNNNNNISHPGDKIQPLSSDSPPTEDVPSPLGMPYVAGQQSDESASASAASPSDKDHSDRPAEHSGRPFGDMDDWKRPGLSLSERWRGIKAEQRRAWDHGRAERRRLGTWRWALRWIQGPDHPPPMRVKHYPWWPWEPLERIWIYWTDPVAWKDPSVFYGQGGSRRGWLSHQDTASPEVAAPQTDPESPSAHAKAGGLYTPQGLRYRSPASVPDASALITQPEPEEERDTQGHPPSAWRKGVLGDLRLNLLHWLLLVITCIGWIFGFAVIARDLWYRSSTSIPSSALSSSSSGSGSDSSFSDTTVSSITPVSFYSCTASFWSYNANCGLNGNDCTPFASSTGYSFRCPKDCLGTTLGATRAVGDQTINWAPLLVGGGDVNQTYRGDSWICQSAVQAGLFSDNTGGCGVAHLIGTHSGFVGADRHGAHSLSFNSTFPLSYRFLPSVSGGGNQCKDERWKGYVLDVILSAWTSFVLRPKTIVLYWILVVLGFWHINMFSEPRGLPPPIGEGFGDFLPCLFGAYVIWKVSIRFVLPAFRVLPIEGTVLWLAWYWIGTLLDVVFANVPLNRLVGSDLASQPGAIPSLVVIVIVIVVLAINQVIFVIRRQGYLPKYLALYATGGVIVGLLAAIPGETVRVHHYILALVLLPGVGFPTRISLMAAALLLGMYLNGIGRWGFDGLIQDTAVVRGDGASGSALPTFATNRSTWHGVSPLPQASGIVAWDPIPTSLAQTYDSFALLVDDVLRYQGGETQFDMGSLYGVYDANVTSTNATVASTTSSHQQRQESNVTLASALATAQALATEPHYLRLAYVSNGNYGDFTMMATVYFNGTWVDASSGRT